MRKIFSSSSFSNIEHVFSGGGGEEFSGEMPASLICDHLNWPMNVIGIAKDISKRKWQRLLFKSN